MGHVPVLYLHERGPDLPYEDRIIGLGGSGWFRTVEEVIADTLSGRNVYTASLNGRSVEIVVVEHNGRRHLALPGARGRERLLRLPRPPERDLVTGRARGLTG